MEDFLKKIEESLSSARLKTDGCRCDDVKKINMLELLEKSSNYLEPIIEEVVKETDDPVLREFNQKIRMTIAEIMGSYIVLALLIARRNGGTK